MHCLWIQHLALLCMLIKLLYIRKQQSEKEHKHFVSQNATDRFARNCKILTICHWRKVLHKFDFRMISKANAKETQTTFEHFSNFCQHWKNNMKRSFSKEIHTGSNDYRTLNRLKSETFLQNDFELFLAMETKRKTKNQFIWDNIIQKNRWWLIFVRLSLLLFI